MKIIKKPGDNEFQANEPMFANLIPADGLLLEHLMVNLQATIEFIQALPKEKLTFRYAEDKWTIKEVIMHLIEMERIYTYRALRFARNDQTPLPGFDASRYILFSGANDRQSDDLLSELSTVRHATVSLLNGFASEAFSRSGNMNGYPVSVCALAYHIAGHELHHIKVIKERYL